MQSLCTEHYELANIVHSTIKLYSDNEHTIQTRTAGS